MPIEASALSFMHWKKGWVVECANTNYSMLSVKIDQRIDLKFLVKLNKTGSESFQTLMAVYSNVCQEHVSEWHKRFCEGQTDVEDDEYYGRPSS